MRRRQIGFPDVCKILDDREQNAAEKEQTACEQEETWQLRVRPILCKSQSFVLTVLQGLSMLLERYFTAAGQPLASMGHLFWVSRLSGYGT